MRVQSMYSHEDMVSDIKADFRRYAELFRPAPAVGRPAMLRILLSSPGFFVVAAYRVRYWIKAWQEETGRLWLRIVLKALNGAADVYAMTVLKSEIPFWPAIGPGLYLSNKGGIILGAERVGAGCVIHHNVTIGMDRKGRHPQIGDRVWIGPGSVVYAPKVGNGVVIAPATVLGKSIPDRCEVKGNPGRITRRDVDGAQYLASRDPYLDETHEDDARPPAAGHRVQRHVHAPLVENLRADVKRYCGRDESLAAWLRVVRTIPGFRASAVYRLSRWTDTALAGPLRVPLRVTVRAVCACLRWAIAAIYGIRIDPRAELGKGLYIGHFAGINVGPCRMGEHCSLHQHVAIYAEGCADDSSPRIGRNVWIGAHARIVGPVTVGSYSTISAGTIVTRDVGERCLVMGNPARVVDVNHDNTDLLGMPDAEVS